jgi:branched-chain amino acid aminotransferase
VSRVVHWLRTRQGSFRRVASVPATDRGFRYGMAVFETIGVRNGEALFLHEHIKKSLVACEASGFSVDEIWFGEAAEFLRGVVKSESSGVARIHVTAGDGSPHDFADRCRMLLSYEARPPVAAAVYERGYRVRVCPEPFAPTLGGRKTHNYWLNIAALQVARLAGADEGLVFNPAGQLVSACMANVFLVQRDGTIVTPPVSSGAREGVVRRWVMRGRNVQERILERSDLQQTQEMFLTNSWLGVMPVRDIDGKSLPNMAVSAPLMSEYHCPDL